MESILHRWIGTALILLSLALAALAWSRVRRGTPPSPLLRALQGVGHLLLTVQVLLGVGMLARGVRIAWIHPILGILALLSLLLPIALPQLKQNRALAAAVVPTAVTILATLAYAIGDAGLR